MLADSQTYPICTQNFIKVYLFLVWRPDQTRHETPKSIFANQASSAVRTLANHAIFITLLQNIENLRVHSSIRFELRVRFKVTHNIFVIALIESQHAAIPLIQASLVSESAITNTLNILSSCPLHIHPGSWPIFSISWKKPLNLLSYNFLKPKKKICISNQ